VLVKLTSGVLVTYGLEDTADLVLVREARVTSGMLFKT